MKQNESTPKKKLSIGKKILIGLVLLMVIGLIVNPNKKAKDKDAAMTNNNIPAKQVGINEVLKTEYFDVVVESPVVTFNIETGNEFADKVADKGNIFVILKTTFKNIDTESRMITDGVLFIYMDGKEYKFEKSESILAEGWGIALKNINPLSSITTKIVYQIPEKLKAKVFYQPARTQEKIFLADFDLTNLK